MKIDSLYWKSALIFCSNHFDSFLFCLFCKSVVQFCNLQHIQSSYIFTPVIKVKLIITLSWLFNMLITILGYLRLKTDIEMMLGRGIPVTIGFFYFAPNWCVISPIPNLVSVQSQNCWTKYILMHYAWLNKTIVFGHMLKLYVVFVIIVMNKGRIMNVYGTDHRWKPTTPTKLHVLKDHKKNIFVYEW